MQNKFFSPVIKILNKFRYSVKIGIISLLLFLFTAGLLLIICGDLDDHIRFAERERVGLEYTDALKNILQDMQQHRALTTAYLHGQRLLDGNGSAKSELISLNKKIDDDIEFINKLQQQNNYVFRMDKLWSQIIAGRQSLKTNALNLSPKENFKKHSLVINKIIF